MADKIERSAYYYELQHKKHAASGRGPNQARVYGELVELVRSCSSLEEIQNKMRAGGYFESPGQALYLDKMLALRDAARDNGLESIALLYQKRHDEVAADYQKAFVTGFEQDIQKEFNRIGNIVSSINEMIAAYLRVLGLHPADGEHGKALAVLAREAESIKKNGGDFSRNARDPYFRKHSPLSDENYEKAIAGIEAIQAGAKQPGDQAEISGRTKAALEVIKPRVEELKELGHEFNSRCDRSAFLSIAPEDAPGPYERTEIYTAKAGG